MTRGLLLTAALLLALALSATPASAYWTAPGTGSGTGRDDDLSAPAISVPATSARPVTVTWTAQSSLNVSSGANGSITYTVERRLGAGVWAAIATGGCSGSLPRGTASCTDRPGANGSYTYRAIAHFHSWSATSAVAGPVVVTLDNTAPTVAINQAAAQADPASALPLRFSVVFSEPVTGFSAAGVSVGGTAGHANPTVVVTSTDSSHYDVAVSNVGGPDGTVTASLLAGAAVDAGENNSAASTSTDNTVTLDTTLHAPTAVTLVNGGGTGGTYVNSGNVSGVTVDVSLDSTSTSADTITLVASDGTSARDVTGTKAATAGAGAVRFTGLNLSGLNQGAITFRATATDPAGNPPASKSLASTKDTVAPAVPTATVIANGKSATGSGTYVNASTVTDSQWTVTLAASANNSASDAITVKLTAGATTASGTLSPAGAASGPVVVHVNATALAQGTISLTATSTDLAGNASAAFSAAGVGTKDTVLPSAPSTNFGVYSYTDNTGATPDTVSGAAGVLTTAGDYPRVIETSPRSAQFQGAPGAANGSFAAFPVDAIPGGSVTYTFYEVDPAGNQSATGTSGTVPDAR